MIDTLDLTSPSWCDCDECDCRFGVDSVFIGTRWDEDAPATIAVCRLDLNQKTDGELLSEEPLPYGGARGPGNWCWRGISYDQQARAVVQSTTTLSQVEATLKGEDNTSARLVADFGTDGYALDLTGCDSIKVVATFNPSRKFTFVIATEGGATMEWDLPERASDTSVVNEYDLSIKPSNDPGSLNYTTLNGSARFPFELNAIRYLGIQKKYDANFEAEEDVTVSSVVFLSPGKPQCENWVEVYPRPQVDVF